MPASDRNVSLGWNAAIDSGRPLPCITSAKGHRQPIVSKVIVAEYDLERAVVWFFDERTADELPSWPKAKLANFP